MKKPNRSQFPLPRAVYLLTEHPDWVGVLGFDQFRQRIEFRRPAPWGYEGAWSDLQEVRLWSYLNQNGIPASTVAAYSAALIVAHDHSFHPVRDYLDLCWKSWDKTARVDTWLTDYLGVPDSPYARAVGRKWLISAAARACSPGIKADCVLVLEGPQGTRKSSTFEALGSPWYTNDVPDLGSKDASMAMAGAWIIELDELDAVSKREATQVKAFISRKVDRFRPSYGRSFVEIPRQSVFGGSTNEGQSLHDWTGNRRYWFVRPLNIDLGRLVNDRDQLWGEALSLYRRGVPHWIDEEREPDLAAEAQREQSERLETDSWTDTVLLWLNQKRSEFETSENQPFFSVSVGEVLHDCIGKKQADHSILDQIRVGRILQANNWRRKRTPRFNGVRQWRYFHAAGCPS